MDVFTLILAGGESKGLSVLVEERPTAAMPFAGKYRIIDFTLSNCANSRLSDVAVLTQYRPHSLNEHVSSGRPWDLDRTRGGIHLWQPYRGRNDQGWQRGTADALYQNRNFIAETGAENLLVLAGDHVYKQDYRPLLRQHIASGANLTMSVRDVPRDETNRFGIVALDEQDRVTDMWEKSDEDHGTLASMGVYVFRTDYLLETLERDAEALRLDPRFRTRHHSVDGARKQRSRLSFQRITGSMSARCRPTGAPTSICSAIRRASISTTSNGPSTRAARNARPLSRVRAPASSKACYRTAASSTARLSIRCCRPV